MIERLVRPELGINEVKFVYSPLCEIAPEENVKRRGTICGRV
jgi:hypothetical protein